MNGVAARAGEARGPRARPGLHGRLLAMGYALAFFGLLLTGAVLLLVMLAPVVLAALGLGQFLKYQLNHGLAFDSQDARDLLGLLLGLACCRFVLPAALLATRRLAMLTRRLSARVVRGGHRRGVRAEASSRRGGQPPSWLPAADELAAQRREHLAGPAVAGGQPRRRVGAAAGAGHDGGRRRDRLPRPRLRRVPGMDGASRWVPPPAFPGNTPSVLLAIGVALVALGLGTGPVALRGYGGLARLVLAPSREAELARRVEQLAQTRRETLDTGAAELRRIERDLHDGAQARLVAMGLTLDAAGRLIDTDPAAARALLYEARDASARALAELRDLVRGIHPPVLADRGLADAIRALALDSPLRVRVTGPLDGRLPAPVESAGYFAVSELLANVAKHSGAGAAEVDLRHSSGSLRITVSDDGAGGADPSRGTGLQGVARRVAAFDGVLVVSSPAGGPTVINLEMPCELS